MDKRGLHILSGCSHAAARPQRAKMHRPSSAKGGERERECIENMKIIERALKEAWEAKPQKDPDGLWRRGWVSGWLTGARESSRLTVQDAGMVALGIRAGLEVQPREVTTESDWNNWAQLWAMIWTQSWMKQCEKMHEENITALVPDILADRVLAAAVRLVQSLKK